MKGIAIETILMLLVGILVVGIIVYMVYRYMLSPSLTIEECRQLGVNFCSSCRAAGCLVTANEPAVCSDISSATIDSRCDTYFSDRPGSCAGSVIYCQKFGIT